MTTFKQFLDSTLKNPYTCMVNDFGTKQDVINWLMWEASLLSLENEVLKTFILIDNEDKHQTIDSWVDSAEDALKEWR